LNRPHSLLGGVADQLDRHERLTRADVLLLPFGLRHVEVFAVEVHDAGSRVELFPVLVADADLEVFARHDAPMFGC
jgi:hypothetical protein